MAHTKLLEHILDGDFVSANSLFEERMLEIQEKKLYEEKRRIAAMNEIVKPLPGKPGEFTGQNEPKDWAKYRKAHPSLGMFDTPAGKGKKPESKVEKKRKAGYVKAFPALKGLEFIKAVTRYHKTGKIDESEILRKYAAAQRELETAVKEKKPKEKAADISAVKTSAEKEKEVKAPKDTSGVSPGMRKYLRQKYREKTGTTAVGLASKSLKKAISPGTSLKGRFRAVSRAGKALSTMPSVKAAKATATNYVAPHVSRIASGLAAFEE